MPWDRRGYYYRPYKRRRRASSRYFGRGPQAELAAAEDALRRADREARKDACRAADHEWQSAMKPLAELSRTSDALLRATLNSTGFHQYMRGAWRRRNHACENDFETT